MGLDMYLSATLYTSQYSDPEIHTKLSAIEIDWPTKSEGSGSIEITKQVAYWRKANQIHDWFVQNVQGGTDECQRSYVDQSQLQELHDLCVETIKTKDTSELEPSEGFFFGGTEIDEYYWQDLQSTIDQLAPLLDEKFTNFSFHYQSSW